MSLKEKVCVNIIFYFYEHQKDLIIDSRNCFYLVSHSFASGKVYQVVKAQHSTQGRGGAIIQVELRDVDSGNKVNERFRTDETVEKIFVEAKSYTYLYTDEETDTIVLME
ncbi:putative ribosomal protein L2, domain 2 [Helianthus annuus]|nr:putative ribosomal protein L2, domain 2 [Helianthus annuus]